MAESRFHFESPVGRPRTTAARVAAARGPAPAVCVTLGVLCLAGMLACLSPATGQAAADPGRDVSLTVYNQDLGLVRDVRTLMVPSEGDWVQFTDVPARIDPTSVHLRPADRGELQVLEQNYRYDLVSSEKILERYLDESIRVIMEEGRLYEGRLLSAGRGELVLAGEDPESGITILTREKVTDLQFPALPEGLITRPTLAWQLVAEPVGERRLEVSYLTGGLNWHAEYVAVVGAQDETMDLAGWVSLENHSGTTYAQAALQLVAGDVNRVRDEVNRAKATPSAELHFRGGGRGFEEESFFEYHLYTLGRRTTLRDNETKQLALFEPAHSRVEKRYECNPRQTGEKVRVVLETTNSEEVGLGMPLPQGTLRVFKRDAREQLQFLGEDRIDHTPRDEKVRVTIGHAFDLVVERTEVDRRRLGPRDQELDVKIEVRNRKQEPVVVIVQEDLYGFWEIVRTSHDYRQESATRVEFDVAVAAGETENVTYTVRYTR